LRIVAQWFKIDEIMKSFSVGTIEEQPMTAETLAQLDHRITVLRKRLETAEKMRDAIKEDPELLDYLLGKSEAAEASRAANGALPTEGKRHGRGAMRQIHGGAKAAANFKKVADYLESIDNRPTGIPEIARAIGLTVNNVIQTMYRSHAVLFDSCAVPGHSTKRAWSLRKDWKEMLARESQQK
jgi:hypothetical protein